MKVLDDNLRTLKENQESNLMFKREEEEFQKRINSHNKMLEAKAQATLWIQAHWLGHKTRTETKK